MPVVGEVGSREGDRRGAQPQQGSRQPGPCHDLVLGLQQIPDFAEMFFVNLVGLALTLLHEQHPEIRRQLAGCVPMLFYEFLHGRAVWIVAVERLFSGLKQLCIEFGQLWHRMRPLREVGGQARRQHRVDRPEDQQDGEGRPRGRRQGGDGEADREDRSEIEQVGAGHQGETKPALIRGGIHSGNSGEDVDSPRGYRHQQRRQRASEPQGLAGYQGSRAHSEAQYLPQGAALPLSRQGPEGEENDEQGQQELQARGRSQITETTHGGGVLRGEEGGLVLAVSLEIDGAADERLQSTVENGQGRHGFEYIDPVVRRGVRVLSALVEPVVPLHLRGLFAFFALVVYLLAGKQKRDTQEGEDDDRRPAETAVSPGVLKFLACDGEGHS